VNFENVDAFSFYLTTMGENQAPARHFFTKSQAQKKSSVGRLSMEGGTRTSATGVGDM
jgi:hypothetical protein